MFIIVPSSFLRVSMLFNVAYRDTQVRLLVSCLFWPFSSTMSLICLGLSMTFVWGFPWTSCVSIDVNVDTLPIIHLLPYFFFRLYFCGRNLLFCSWLCPEWRHDVLNLLFITYVFRCFDVYLWRQYKTPSTFLLPLTSRIYVLPPLPLVFRFQVPFVIIVLSLIFECVTIPLT